MSRPTNLSIIPELSATSYPSDGISSFCKGKISKKWCSWSHVDKTCHGESHLGLVRPGFSLPYTSVAQCVKTMQKKLGGGGDDRKSMSRVRFGFGFLAHFLVLGLCFHLELLQCPQQQSKHTSVPGQKVAIKFTAWLQTIIADFMALTANLWKNYFSHQNTLPTSSPNAPTTTQESKLFTDCVGYLNASADNSFMIKVH